MTRGYVVLMAAIVSLAGTPAVVQGQSPADISVGYTPLTLVAEGARTDQLGGDSLYTFAVYAEARPLDELELAAFARNVVDIDEIIALPAAAELDLGHKRNARALPLARAIRSRAARNCLVHAHRP